VIQGVLASRRDHVVAFPAPQGAELALRETRPVLARRVLARGPQFKNILDLVPAGDWLLALRLDGGLVGLNLRTGTIRDFSDVLARQRPYVKYEMMWRGQGQGEAFLGTIARKLIRLSVTSEGAVNITHAYARPIDTGYSLPMAGDNWLSNGYWRDGTTLMVGQLSGDRLTGHAVNGPVFPGLSPLVSLDAHWNSVAARPDGERMAQVYWYAPLVHIYDSSGGLVQSMAAPVSVTQRFTEHMVSGNARMQFLPQTTRCYVDVTAQSKRVLALFSGQQPLKSSGRIEGSQLQVLTWEGQFAAIVNLDSLVSRIAATPDGDLLWAARRGLDPEIVEYRLPGLPQ